MTLVENNLYVSQHFQFPALLLFILRIYHKLSSKKDDTTIATPKNFKCIICPFNFEMTYTTDES